MRISTGSSAVRVQETIRCAASRTHLLAVTYWNREAASLYGFSAQEAVGKPLRSLHAADLSDCAR